VALNNFVEGNPGSPLESLHASSSCGSLMTYEKEMLYELFREESGDGNDSDATMASLSSKNFKQMTIAAKTATKTATTVTTMTTTDAFETQSSGSSLGDLDRCLMIEGVDSNGCCAYHPDVSVMFKDKKKSKVFGIKKKETKWTKGCCHKCAEIREEMRMPLRMERENVQGELDARFGDDLSF